MCTTIYNLYTLGFLRPALGVEMCTTIYNLYTLGFPRPALGVEICTCVQQYIMCTL